YNIIPLPIPLENSKNYVYVDKEADQLIIDVARQYYFMLQKSDLKECKILRPKSYAFKQKQPLLSTHLNSNCIVSLLQPRTNILENCEKRVINVPTT
ncbi:hypothetical protein C0J52_21160, partial [Blattella germanica]